GDEDVDGSFSDVNDNYLLTINEDEPTHGPTGETTHESPENSIDLFNASTDNLGESVFSRFFSDLIDGPSSGPASDPLIDGRSNVVAQDSDVNLEPAIYPRLVDGLSDILIIVEIVQHLFRAAFTVISESCRIQVDHLWNFLLHRFFNDGTSSPHKDISPRMIINYSKNLRFEQVMNGDMRGAGERSLSRHRYCVNSLRKRQMSRDCPSVIKNNLKMMELNYVVQAYSMLDHRDTAELAIRQHGVSEPSHGFLSGVLGVSIPISGASEEQTRSAFFQDMMRSRALVHEASEGRWDYLWFPTALLWHSESAEPNDAAMNEMKLQLTSAVAFYYALGIGNQPVWGLVTHGTVVEVLYACRGEVMSQYTYVFDNNLAWFDICDPLSCYRFCVFLLRLSEKNKELRKKIEEGGYVDRFFTQLEDDSLDNWTVQSVRDKFREFHEPHGL
ncbi:hypothetical protein H0H92_008748, partial [Tricholoma furcatifolium]